MDLSPDYVSRAQELAEQEGVADRVTYLVGDLRRLRDAVPKEAAPFDAAMNVWTSLGYYDDSTDEQILRGYASVVRPGGLFLLYIVNRDFVVRHFSSQNYEEFGDVVEIEQAHLDLDVSRMKNDWRFFRKRGEDLRHRTDSSVKMRLLTPHEADSLLEAAGWHVDAAYGGWGREAVSAERRKLVLVARPTAGG
jgi:SAM-dependent methyltransferase